MTERAMPPRKRQMHRFQLLLPKSDYSRLVSEADRLGKSAAIVVREALREHFDFEDRCRGLVEDVNKAALR